MKIQKSLIKISLAAAIVTAAYHLHRSGLLPGIIPWIEGMGPARPIVFVMVCTLASVFFIPSFLFTFAGGFLFDFWTAVFLSIMGAGLGAVSAFLIGRYLARSAVEKYTSGIPEFKKIAALVEKKGWKIVLLARLSPIFPFLAGNYAFGTTQMSARHYFFASLLGTIPSVVVYTYSGRIAGSLAGMGSRTQQEWILLGIGLIASVAISIYLRQLAQKELQK